MAMELRLAYANTSGDAQIDHITLGDPGDHGVVVLIDVDLKAAIGGEAFEALDTGEIVVTKNGINYTVQPCAVRQTNGKQSSMFYFIGVPTAYVPQAP